MKRTTYLATAVLLVASGGFAAKDKDKDFDNQHMDPYVAGQANEAKMIRDIRHRLLEIPYYGVFDDLGFTVNGTTVTLVGAVTLPVVKDDAEHAVKRVEGVTNVIDNIEVLPLSPMDDGIRRAAYRAIYDDPFLSDKVWIPCCPLNSHHRKERAHPSGRCGGQSGG